MMHNHPCVGSNNQREVVMLLRFACTSAVLCSFTTATLAADPTPRDEAITAAAAQGRLEDLRALVEAAKTSPEVLNDALVGAARSGHARVVKYLLSREMDVERPSAVHGMTALDAAVRHGHRDVAEELVRGGAKPATAEQLAALGLDRQLAAALRANPKLLASEKPDETRMQLLHTAAAHGRVTTVEYLLTQVKSVDLVGSGGITPLHVAAMHGRKEVVALLLDRKAAVDPHTSVCFLAGLHAGAHTPLHLAVGQNHPDVVALLCYRGARLDDQSFPFDRMLNHALYHGQAGLVDVLVAKRGKEQWPTLLNRALNGNDLLHHPELVLEALVRLGVDVAKVLPEPPIHWAIARDYRRLAIQFIDRGADVRRVHDFGTPLARAAERGQDEIVARLLEKKADVDTGTTTGTTPMQFAVFGGRLTTVQLLLKHGASTKRIDAATQAELARSPDADRRAIAEILRQHEAGK
jgi:ankyrin repeat protein